MKTQVLVVIIGGVSLGVILMYHLCEEGWNDVVLIEKGELTSGSTWHAAGLCPNFNGNHTLSIIHLYVVYYTVITVYCYYCLSCLTVMLSIAGTERVKGIPGRS